MSHVSRKHKAKAPIALNFAVIVCSTARYKQVMAGTAAEDESGDLIAELLKQQNHAVTLRKVISDDAALIKENLSEALQHADAVIFCGGTGISPADITIETITPLFEKELYGFGEVFRWLSYQAIGSAAVMTRAAAGIVQGKVVFCIPGSPQAVRLCLEKLILPEAGHILLHASGKG